MSPVASPVTPLAFWSIALPEFDADEIVPGVMLSDQLLNVVVLPKPEFLISSVQVPLIDCPFNEPSAPWGRYGTNDNPWNGGEGWLVYPAGCRRAAIDRSPFTESNVVSLKFTAPWVPNPTFRARTIRVPSGAIRVRIRSGSKEEVM